MNSTSTKESGMAGSTRTSTLNGLKHYSNDGLRTTYQHILGIQGMARKAKENGVHEEAQGYLDAILKEASNRKVIL